MGLRRPIAILCWALLLVLVGMCFAGALRLVQTTWYQRSAGPVTGSFASGPINQYFSAGQTIAMSGSAVARIDIKLGQYGDRRDVQALVEVRDGPDGASLRSGRVRLRPGSAWYSLRFPEIGATEAASGSLYLEIRSLSGAPLRDADKVSAFYEHGDQYPGGRMYTLGEPANPDYDLAMRVYRQAPPRQFIATFRLLAAVGTLGPAIAAAAAIAAMGLLGGLMLWPATGWPASRWIGVIVGLSLLLVALNLPMAAANPAIVTAVANLS